MPADARPSATPMAPEDSAAILGAARDRDGRALVRALERLATDHPTTWPDQLVRLATSRGDVDRLWIMSHVHVDARVNRVTFGAPRAPHPMAS